MGVGNEVTIEFRLGFPLPVERFSISDSRSEIATAPFERI